MCSHGITEAMQNGGGVSFGDIGKRYVSGGIRGILLPLSTKPRVSYETYQMGLLFQQELCTTLLKFA